MPNGPFQTLNPVINRPVIFLTALLLTQSLAVGGEFTRTLTPEKMRDAGLAKLTPEELAELEILVQLYKTGEPANAPATATAATATTAPAAPVADQAAKSSKILPAWVGALLTLEKTNTDPGKSDALESQLQGSFSGWSGRTTFRLENGQLWIQANSDRYEYSSTLHSPKVKIYPASLGTYWLAIEGVNQRCRVKPMKLQ